MDRSRAEKITRYFDTTAYAAQATGTFGNAPRAESQLRAPRKHRCHAWHHEELPDAGRVAPSPIPLGDLQRLQPAELQGPGTGIDSPSSFGRITSAGDGRIIQLGLKYIF